LDALSNIATGDLLLSWSFRRAIAPKSNQPCEGSIIEIQE
jgi:hypothetical protein